ncbi:MULTISPECIES: aminoacyl-histidine dipeptidase [unclassified Gilliamella]|uniref:aminoacyl-histidine dipeptidase n=1 Tax=unclassified Gilliamella TaxID=2685620 RepID=UPI002269F6F7|nr:MULTISPECIES: aminoacyl-histidine dipeptidase [unclassified Gilliamella]MCX8601317.1 aminoacyl-histidine dipeptidase [Gilliamella sp. B3722]MCX8608672.1 aminoacyl-histidine dipeptidase [Gilliamella sp. B3771]MCX8610713.1 aminoacyl-histidine dipeptidase [Gilliamella sp. B3891]MCX8613048.1 aminoacyl-histidine dipeptidase [Gilliamella sp. B3773]MCX8615455.1 aminoacyl-histidine dipeptidase [Gilliamella sp. B3770]
MLSHLNPKFVWQIFNDICKIPHPSHYEQMITKYIVDFAISHHIEHKIDKAGNILLTKSATKGMENCPSIALQAHMDMVPQKNEGTNHDFFTDPINAYVDGEWVKAKGTTLGADNGVGLASALAVLIDPAVEHGPIEVLVTTSEETGMHGAFGLQPNWLKSQFLINTDSEDEGEIFTGCAGGVDFTTTFAVTYAVMPEKHDCYMRISLKGLKGGHSGCDIHLGRGNAIKLMARFLAEYAQDISFRLADIQGGSLRNAIPREAFVEITLSKEDLPKLKSIIEQYQQVLQNEFGQVEPSLSITLSDVESDKIKRVLTTEHQNKIINWLNAAPNGVIRMSNQIHGVVETSLNLGILNILDNQLNVHFLIRSQVDSNKDAVVSTLVSLSQLVNANYEISGGYSGWEPNLNSTLLQLAKDKYQEIFSQKAKIMVIHAGLECGLFKKSYPDMDMISIGPTIVSPHSPDEKVNIQSVYRYWELLIAILKSASLLKK